MDDEEGMHSCRRGAEKGEWGKEKKRGPWVSTSPPPNIPTPSKRADVRAQALAGTRTKVGDRGLASHSEAGPASPRRHWRSCPAEAARPRCDRFPTQCGGSTSRSGQADKVRSNVDQGHSQQVSDMPWSIYLSFNLSFYLSFYPSNNRYIHPSIYFVTVR